MKDSYLTAGIRLPLFIKLLRRHKLSWHPKKILRILFILQSSLWASLFARIEKARTRQTLNDYIPPADPIFIIGHWRTGSTFLHQILACDPNLTAPTLFQVAQPEGFLTTRRYFRYVFSIFLAKSRPMDNVRLGMDEPQEEEYAIYRMTAFSPLEQLIFPKKRIYFLNEVDSFIPTKGYDREQWLKMVKLFFKKVSYAEKRQVVSKNPFHSFRIEALMELFPEAKFIHIVRNPLDVVPSTIHMWTIVQKQNCLSDAEHLPDIEEVCGFINRLNDEIREKKTLIKNGSYAEIRYEELEQNPIKSVKELYSMLGLKMTSQFEDNIRSFLSENIDFQKNKYQTVQDQKQKIRSLMSRYLTDYHYDT